MNASGIPIYAGALILIFLNFAFSFWPFSVVAILLLVLYGHTASGIILGLLLDLLFGAPVGVFSLIPFPFFFFSLLCLALRVFALSRILEKGDLGAI